MVGSYTACCHTALVFAIKHLYNFNNFFVFVYCFHPFLFGFYLNVETEWLMKPACNSFCALLTEVILKGLTL